MQLTHAEGMSLKHKTGYEPNRYRSHWKMLDGSFLSSDTLADRVRDSQSDPRSASERALAQAPFQALEKVA